MGSLGRKYATILICYLCLNSFKAYAGQISPPPVLEGQYSLLINIDGLVCCKGVLRVAVYHHKDYWLRDNGMVRGRLGMVTSEKHTLEIHGLPAGTYAVAVHQDVNGDGKFNRLLGVVPKEPYGFSNNIGKFSPPSFEKAAFFLGELGDEMQAINIHVRQALGGKGK